MFSFPFPCAHLGGFAHVYLVRSAAPVNGTIHHVLKRMLVADHAMLQDVKKEVDIMVSCALRQHIATRSLGGLASLFNSYSKANTKGSSEYRQSHRFCLESPPGRSLRSLYSHGILRRYVSCVIFQLICTPSFGSPSSSTSFA